MWIVLLYLSLICVFNFFIIHYSIIKIPDRLTVFGEWPIYEYVAEIVRLNILRGSNPYNAVPAIFPFGWSFALDDMSPINGWYFLVLRPFFTVHNSFTVIVLASIFLNNLFMYLLLRKLKISQASSIILSLVFGFSPYVAIRLGQPSYLDLYLFPMILFCIVSLLQKKGVIHNIVYAFLLGLACCITLLTNLYFTVMIAILFPLLLIAWYIFNPKDTLKYAKERIKYFVLSGIVATVLLLPWLEKAYNAYISRGGSIIPVLYDAQIFSADLFGIFMPSPFGSVFGKFIEYIGAQLGAQARFENFVYPGIIILAGYVAVVFSWRKLPVSLQKKILPMFLTGIFFWILSLGPRLQVAGNITSIRLPFVILQKIPLANLARAPGRFIIPFIFMGSICTAFLLDYFIKKRKPEPFFYKAFFVCLFLIFLVDQSYTATFTNILFPVPNKTYAYVAKKGNGPLLEIPFVIRDGLRYFGDYDAVWHPRTQLLYKKPMFSLYAGRLHEDIFAYYTRDPFLGFIASKIDKKNTLPIKEPSKESMIRSINFFGIENILLKTDEIYSKEIQKDINNLGFEKILIDGNHALFFRKSLNNEETEIDFSQPKEYQLGYGWSTPEKEGRWIVGKGATAFLKLNKIRPVNITFEASTFVEKQTLTLFVNGSRIKKIKLGKDKKEYAIEVEKDFQKGINKLTLVFGGIKQPSHVDKSSKDMRNLAAFFTHIKVTDIKN